jgi:hypothetical protein
MRASNTTLSGFSHVICECGLVGVGAKGNTSLQQNGHSCFMYHMVL